MINSIHENVKLFQAKCLKAKYALFQSLKIRYLRKAASFASQTVGGFYVSPEIEKILGQIGQQYRVPLPDKFDPNSTLHVLTQCCLTGGHTRVVEQWVEAKGSNNRQSVVLIKQKKEPIPPRLRAAVAAAHGEFLQLKGGSISKALVLRKLAAKYETVILHVHMDEVVPLLAFGTPDFKRPVHFYNHADHLFWLGASIADSVIHFRTTHLDITTEYRGIKKNFYLPLPVKEPPLQKKNIESINNIKQKLKIPLEAKVIVSMGFPYKFTPFDDLDFARTMMQIIEKKSNTYVVVIGPSLNEPYWDQYHKQSAGHIIPLGIVPYSEVDTYLPIADLAIDSFPLGSSIAFMDMAKYKIPCLSLLTPVNALDIYFQAKVLCQNIDELVTRATMLLEQPEAGNFYELLKENHFADGFSQHLERLYKKLPLTHQIHTIIPSKKEITPFEVFFQKVFSSIAQSERQAIVEKKFLGITWFTIACKSGYTKYFLFGSLRIWKVKNKEIK